MHPEVTSTVIVNVARTDEEAERQAAGETVVGDQQDEQNNVEEVNVEEIFDEGVDVKLEDDAAEEEEAPVEEETPTEEEAPAEEEAEEESSDEEESEEESKE